MCSRTRAARITSGEAARRMHIVERGAVFRKPLPILRAALPLVNLPLAPTTPPATLAKYRHVYSRDRIFQ